MDYLKKIQIYSGFGIHYIINLYKPLIHINYIIDLDIEVTDILIKFGHSI